MKKTICILFSLLSVTFLSAQDIHFSQFYAAPILTNPANTGNFTGALRLGLNYRDQWGSVTVPYRTFSVYADGGIQPKKAVNRFGLGVSAFTDQAGDGVLSTDKVYLSGAYHIGYTENSTVRFAMGLTGGLVQKSVDITKLSFNSQWNDFEFDETLSNNETPTVQTIDYVDLGAGALLTIMPYEGERYTLGLSLMHINEPQESFFGDDNKVGIKYTATLGGFFAAGGIASFQPQILFASQDNASEIIAGTNVSIPMNAENNGYNSIFVGAWYRYKDAFWLVGGAQMDKLIVSISYDLNVSMLRSASSTRGGLEIAAAYVFGGRKKDPLTCPAYQ
jgi:type IX secretion system PorP/SprF family membrane protein